MYGYDLYAAIYTAYSIVTQNRIRHKQNNKYQEWHFRQTGKYNTIKDLQYSAIFAGLTTYCIANYAYKPLEICHNLNNLTSFYDNTAVTSFLYTNITHMESENVGDTCTFHNHRRNKQLVLCKNAFLFFLSTTIFNFLSSPFNI